VLSGLLLNDTILQPQFHHTDTGGVTDHIFAFCHLLGIEFMPRIKDLPDQSLFKLDRHQNYGELDCLFDQTVPRDLIAEQWDQMVRVSYHSRTGWRLPRLLWNAWPTLRRLIALPRH
jgi:TnpA family transposase